MANIFRNAVNIASNKLGKLVDTVNVGTGGEKEENRKFSSNILAKRYAIYRLWMFARLMDIRVRSQDPSILQLNKRQGRKEFNKNLHHVNYSLFDGSILLMKKRRNKKREKKIGKYCNYNRNVIYVFNKVLKWTENVGS